MLELDETSFNAVINYCEKTMEWEKVLYYCFIANTESAALLFPGQGELKLS